MVNIFSSDLALALAGWTVAVSASRAGGGRVSRANWRATPLSTRPLPVRSMILAMNPLDSITPISSIQSRISAVEVRIEGVQAQIAVVAELVKAVQSQVADVGARIEMTKIDLKQAELLPDDREVLMLDIKSLMDKKGKLMDKKKGLEDEKKILMDEEKGLMDKKKGLMNKDGNGYFISLQDAFIELLLQDDWGRMLGGAPYEPNAELRKWGTLLFKSWARDHKGYCRIDGDTQNRQSLIDKFNAARRS